MTIDVRFVTQAELPPLDTDTPRLGAALEAAGARVDIANWRDPAVDWSAARLTMLRSPWDWGVLLCLAFTAGHPLYWGNLRMRAPLMPFVALVAAAALSVPRPPRGPDLPTG